MRNILKNIINDFILNENVYLIEGIDIDPENRLVSFNKNHEDGVVTSELLNPTYENIGDTDVISIFKRVRSQEYTLDGNPLIYALKGINGWRFKNGETDIIGLMRQFIKITQKIKSSYDTIITVPSSNKLNTEFLYRLNKIIKCEHKITDYLHKLTIDDVYENYIDWTGLRQDYGDGFNGVKHSLDKFFSNMLKSGEYFSFKYIKDPSLRKYITTTIYSDDEKTIEYGPYINGKDVLILDDTIGSGKTVSEVCETILVTFEPKTITVITLFSKL